MFHFLSTPSPPPPPKMAGIWTLNLSVPFEKWNPKGWFSSAALKKNPKDPNFVGFFEERIWTLLGKHMPSLGGCGLKMECPKVWFDLGLCNRIPSYFCGFTKLYWMLIEKYHEVMRVIAKILHILTSIISSLKNIYMEKPSYTCKPPCFIF